MKPFFRGLEVEIIRIFTNENCPSSIHSRKGIIVEEVKTRLSVMEAHRYHNPHLHDHPIASIRYVVGLDGGEYFTFPFNERDFDTERKILFLRGDVQVIPNLLGVFEKLDER